MGCDQERVKRLLEDVDQRLDNIYKKFLELSNRFGDLAEQMREEKSFMSWYKEQLTRMKEDANA